jgi:putative membrane protein
MTDVAWEHLVDNFAAAAAFSTLGIVLFIIGFWLFKKVMPGDLWKELLEDQNTALAVLMGGVSIALAIIIAAAVA